MKKWFVVAAALVVILAIPAAYAAASSNEKPKSATAAQAQSPDKNAAKACKAERKSMGVAAFQKKYGTNANLRNAFGKCVSAKSKDDKDETHFPKAFASWRCVPYFFWNAATRGGGPSAFQAFAAFLSELCAWAASRTSASPPRWRGVGSRNAQDPQRVRGDNEPLLHGANLWPCVPIPYWPEMLQGACLCESWCSSWSGDADNAPKLAASTHLEIRGEQQG